VKERERERERERVSRVKWPWSSSPRSKKNKRQQERQEIGEIIRLETPPLVQIIFLWAFVLYVCLPMYGP
jgi:hypothetical protein